MTDNYEDIIGHPHHVSENHPQMPPSARAAQFAPFSALNGHSRALEATVGRHIERENRTLYSDSQDFPE